MTGAVREPYELDVYFKSQRFIKRLDKIRQLNLAVWELKDYVNKIIKQMGMQNKHFGVIFAYLINGNYEPKAEIPTIMLAIDSELMPPAKSPIHTGFWAMDNLKGKVTLVLNEDTTTVKLEKFIKENSKDIKLVLDNIYPGRAKTFKPLKNIDKYLAIADEYYSSERTKDIPNPITHDMHNLAIKFNLDPSEIRKAVKRFKPIA